MEIKCEVVILAAGKGTRMRSAVPKVLQVACGWSLIRHVFAACAAIGAEKIYPVLGFGQAEVEAEIGSWSASGFRPKYSVVSQPTQRGTGDALRLAFAAIEKQKSNLPVVILSGDSPLVTADVIAKLVDRHEKAQASLTVASTVFPDPTGYGRLFGPPGFVEKCVEEKDATDEERKATLVNGGMYVASPNFLAECLPKLTPSPVTGELYLTELIELGNSMGRTIATETVAPEFLLGVNTLPQLIEAQTQLYLRRASELLSSGVRIEHPGSVFVAMNAIVAAGVIVEPNVQILGESKIGENVVIESGCRLRNATVRAGARIRANSVLEDCVVGENAVVGPMAHLRPGAELGNNTKIGNFVEIKKSVIGRGSKVSHLSYVGDAEVGEDVNIGCGFVACNYDGVKKSKTTIGDRAFIGSSVQAVAPVTIHEDSYVATGSVINRDVPSGDLAIGRSRQVNKSGYAARLLPRSKKKENS